MHDISDIQSNHPGEISTVTPADRERAKTRQELLDTIQENISPLSMQVKREIMLAVRLLMK